MKLDHNHVDILNFKCVSCSYGFKAKSSLIRHRISSHGKSKIKCRNKANKSCKWGDNDGEDCLYDHTESPQEKISEEIKCNSCSETFQHTSQFLRHRRAKHPDTVKECKSIKEGKKCNFGDQCGFSHTGQAKWDKPLNHVDLGTQNANAGQTTKNANEIFWKVPATQNPPGQLEEIMRMIQTMMKDICQLKEQQMNLAKN